MNPELTCFIGNSRNDTAFVRRRPYHDRFATQLRSVELLDRSIESIHVCMKNYARHAGIVLNGQRAAIKRYAQLTGRIFIGLNLN